MKIIDYTGIPAARDASKVSFKSLWLQDLIRKRRSVRIYEPREVPKEVLERVVEAGLWAPSGKNIQNWHFYVLTGEKKQGFLKLSQKAWDKIRDTLVKRLKPSLYAFTERFFYTLGEAPVVILAYAEQPGINNPQSEIGNVYMAVQNIVLAAQAEGLGSCVMGSPLEIENDVTTFLGIESSKKQKLVCGIVLGYPAHEPPTPERREGRITWLDK